MTEPAKWRRAWRDKILPAVVQFQPDFILISAGFDAHKKDHLAGKYVGIQEKDYEWVTDQIVQVLLLPSKLLSQASFNVLKFVTYSPAKRHCRQVRAVKRAVKIAFNVADLITAILCLSPQYWRADRLAAQTDACCLASNSSMLRKDVVHAVLCLLLCNCVGGMFENHPAALYC